MGSPFTGTVQAKLIDHGLNDFGTPDNPLFTAGVISASIGSIKSVSSTNTAAGDHIVVAAIPNNRIVVFALSIFASTGVNSTINFTDGPGGIVLFSALAISTNQSSMQFGQAVSLPSFLFYTGIGNALIMNLSTAITGVANISYFTISDSVQSLT